MLKIITLKILKIFDSYYQSKIFKFLKKKNFKNFDIFFDVGAHKGESIDLFSRNFNIKEIYSFEPSPKNFDILKENKNELQSKFKDLKITIENYALGSTKKNLTLKQVNESSSSTINDINRNSKYLKRKSFFLNLLDNDKLYYDINIQQIKLIDYLNEKNINKVDFLKIDTEGYEYEVLKGLENHMSKISLVMFEHHYHDMLLKNYTFSDIHGLLIKKNFKKIYKSKMPFRKTFEYIYVNNKL
jgi:FkbM family methyltransferase